MLRVPRLYGLGSARGSMVTGMMISTFAIGVAATTYFVSNGLLRSSVQAARKDQVGNLGEILLSRAAQAIAKNAVLCSTTYNNECRVSSTEAAQEYALLNVRRGSSVKNLLVDAEVCMPSNVEDASVLGRCDIVKAQIEFALIEFTELQNQKIVTGVIAVEDRDPWAVKATVRIPVKQPDGRVSNVENAAIIRRPRSFVRFEVTPRGCERSCVLAEGNRENPPCMGVLENNSSSIGGASATVRVVNDGPGWVYAVKVRRRFIPHPHFAAANPETVIQVYDSAQHPEHANGIPPGQYAEFVDSTIPCFYETVSTTVSGDADSVNTVVTRNARDSGDALYSLVPASGNLNAGILDMLIPNAQAAGAGGLEPQNPLFISNQGVTVPATLSTVITTVAGTSSEVPTTVTPEFGGDGAGGGSDGDGN